MSEVRATGLSPRCANCGGALTGDWCASCGQRRTAPLGFKRVLAAAAKHLLELEGPLPRTLIDLTLRPGTAARHYVLGARKRYVNPLKYLFWVFTIYLVVLNLSELTIFQIGFVANQALEVDPAVERAARLYVNLMGYLIFLLLLPVAFIQRWVFPGRFNAAECYVFNAYVAGHVTWLSLLQLPFFGTRLEVVTVFLVLVQIPYIIWAFRGFYGPGVSVVLRAMLMIIITTTTNGLGFYVAQVIGFHWTGAGG